jgi:hypothetical protein
MRISRFAIPVCVALLLSSCDEPTDPEDDRVIIKPVNTELTGVVGGLTESPPEVRAIRESDGSPVAGVVVEFRLPLISQVGVISRSVDTTDASGIASADAWQLGRRAGLQTLHAFVFQYTASATLVARARAGAPASLSRAGAATQHTLTGRQPYAPSVLVQDAYGNGIEGLDATFSPGQNGGSVGVPATKTTSTGFASAGTWTLPPVLGSYSVAAIVATQVLDFTAHRVDSAALSWYALDSIRQGANTVLPAAWNFKSIRLGLTVFDSCLCVNLAGSVFEIADYVTGQHYENSGSFIVSVGKGILWDYDELKVTANGVMVLRVDYYSPNPITYFYTRRN